MKDNNLLRFWYITYYISGILIPLMIVFGFIFNHFNIFNMIFSILACVFQFAMFLGLQLHNHKVLFMYSTIFLTIIHFCTLIYLIYMTQTLTKHIRNDLEKDISANQTEMKYNMQINIFKCCQLDRSSSHKTSLYFQENYPNHCLTKTQYKTKPCWPSFELMSLLTKIIYWLTWFFQSILLILAWIYYFRIGQLSEQPSISPRKTLEQFYSEILIQSRPYKMFIKQNQNIQINTITNEKNLKRSTSNIV